MKTTQKIDLYKLKKNDYATPRKPVLLEVGEATYLAIAGTGEPGGKEFTDRIGALYGMAFTVKMTRKFGGKQDYAVCKLEAQWWAGGCEGDFAKVPKEQWHWKLMIRTPDFVRETELAKAREVLLKRGKTRSVQEVRLESITEGPCVQMLHVGPYDREPETVALMKAHAEKGGCKLHGRHHEIYLSDPRRVPAERLRTILRIPVVKASD
jgi:hypothetical protein